MKSILSTTLSLVFTLVIVTPANAFWPFDGWKSKGEVKAAVSEEMGRWKFQPDSNLKKAHALFVMLSDIDASCKNLELPLFTGVYNRKYSTQPEISDRIMGSMGLTGSLSNPGELTSIISVLKTRCENNAKLLERLKKVYTGSMYLSDLLTLTEQPSTEPQITKQPYPTRPYYDGTSSGSVRPLTEPYKPSLLERLRRSRDN